MAGKAVTSVILALDISQRCTGFAHDSREAGRPLTGVFRAPKAGGSAEEGWDYGITFAKYHEWLDDMLAAVRPAICAFEAPLNVAGMRRTTRLNSQTTVRILLGLAAITEMALKEHGIRAVEANISSVKKHFAGHGFADKAAIMARCHQLGWLVENNDAADAAAVWAYAKALHDPSWAPRSTPLFGRRA
jgi:Holliday junction resolvasome RuvABC endonuclease subunit